eukprot:TRINITY_DN2353_c0_g2_i1.p1 TRINITY_DN2353_c0_g2~~TRINITY_DN2353_c0_g2_i1.p1  ORF type:complete len:535 (-),score=104.21 TRINITY_DN2353_c0_g2_i1:619-2223(-)
MLIQSSLPNSIRAPLSFIADHGMQNNSDLRSNWAHYSEILHNSQKSDECHWVGCRKSTSIRKEEDDASTKRSVLHLMTGSNLSANEDMCACSTPGRSEYVYKRRKKNENNATIFSEQAAIDSTKGGGSLLSSISSEQLSLTDQKCDNLDSRNQRETEDARASVVPVSACRNDLCPQNPVVTHSRQINGPTSLNITSFDGLSNREDKGIAQPSTDTDRKLAQGHSTNANDSCSSSKSNVEHGSAFTKTEADDTAECSSSDIVVSEILRRSSENVAKRTCDSTDIIGVDEDTSCSKFCKICGDLDNSLKMLICDLCEEAFHLSCCNPQVQQIPVDEWYCRSCLKKKPKPLLEIMSTPSKTLNIVSETSEYRKRALISEYGPILFMLKDTEPYTTGVRIGESFQANVPDWSGPISDDSNEFGEALELDPVEYGSLNERDSNQSSRPSSIGNWLQCHEVIYESTDDDVGVSCGKWRRAPLFEVQTDDWDCSCAVVWDPIHADCAVPQELPTPEVMKHLKYIELLRPRLAAKETKPTRT